MKNSKINLILVALLVIAAFLLGSLWTKTKYQEGKKENLGQVTPSPVQPTVEPLPTTIGNFLVTEEEICQENDKPLVYFFGSSSCPHCVWEKPIIQKVATKFKNEIVYHENFDSRAESEVFERYASINPGYVPFLILGCKYVRVGSGETAGEVEEEKNLTALICKLTDGRPEKICDQVKELVSQIQ